MFTDAQLCPCIFASKWVSHEESCGASKHECLACKYCWANINYWGNIDSYLGQPGMALSTSQDYEYDERKTIQPKTAGPGKEKRSTTKSRLGKSKANTQVEGNLERNK